MHYTTKFHKPGKKKYIRCIKINTMKALWLYFDVPYTMDSSIMRAIFGFEEKGNIAGINIYPCKDIPEAIRKMETICKEKKLSITKELVYVIPLDLRHGLAGIVREFADKHECNFSRQIPSALYPPAEQLLLYSAYDEASSEMKLDKPAASERVAELERKANEESAYGDMLPVFSALRQAIRLSVTHFGWNSPITVHPLVNMILACAGTGNDENIFESVFLVKQLVCAMNDTSAAKTNWSGHEQLPAELAGILIKYGHTELAAELQQAFTKLK
jgi:hypothetical protein